MTDFTCWLAAGSGSSPLSFNELSGNGYSRMQIALTLASPYRLENTGAVRTGPVGTGSWNVTQFGIYDAASAGNLLLAWMAPSPLTIAAGVNLEIAYASIILKLPHLQAAMQGAAAATWLAGTTVGDFGPGSVGSGNPIVAGSTLLVTGGGSNTLVMQAQPTFLQGLPTTIPAVSGQLWNNGGVIAIS